ncbi:MAG: cupredoxin domain-containing protein [Nanoarchaeota archaeon]
MKKNLIIIVVIVLLIVGAGVYFIIKSQPPEVGIPESPGMSEGYHIEISNFAFSPQTLSVQAGDAVTITWINNDLAPHTITSDTGNELGSASFGNGKTFSHTFSVPGTYAYHCSIHPSMKGQIIVE